MKKKLVEIADYYRMSSISQLTKPQQTLFWEAKEQGYVPINKNATQKVG